MYVNESQNVPPFHFSALCDIFEVFFQKKFFKKIFKFCSQSGNSDFPVISSMKGTLWVSRKCFQSFSWIRPEHIKKTLRFLSLRYSADFRRSRLVSFSAYNLTLNGPLFLQSLFICSTNFLRRRRSWVRFSH